MGSSAVNDAERERKTPVWWHSLVASAISSTVSRACTYPADTIKARLQVQGALSEHAYSSTVDAFRKVAASEGLAGFYRGFAAVLAGAVPATVVYYASYELGKSRVPPTWGMAGDFSVGAFAQLSAGFIFTPIDIIKERLQVQKLTGAKLASPRQAVAAILRRDGPRGLLKGYWVTNFVWLPWTSFYIAFYEAAKRSAAVRLGHKDISELPGWTVAACSGSAAAAAALLTHPLDVVKTRLQVLSAGPAGRRLTASAVARDLLRKEGIAGFSRGCLARMMQISPGAAIQWLLYEKVKAQLLASHEASH